MARDLSYATTEIKQKLATLAARDPNYQIFGARSHRYKLGPAIPEGRLSGIERDYGVRLPEDYRHFLREIGSGGAGPYHGLFRLRGADAKDFTDPEDLTDCDTLGKPFPWTEKILRPRRPGIPGALYICHYGCALRFILVVTGKCRGEVWHDWQADRLGVYPAAGERGERLSFYDWYMQWLDSSLKKR